MGGGTPSPHTQHGRRHTLPSHAAWEEAHPPLTRSMGGGTPSPHTQHGRRHTLPSHAAWEEAHPPLTRSMGGGTPSPHTQHGRRHTLPSHAAWEEAHPPLTIIIWSICHMASRQLKKKFPSPHEKSYEALLVTTLAFRISTNGSSLCLVQLFVTPLGYYVGMFTPGLLRRYVHPWVTT